MNWLTRLFRSTDRTADAMQRTEAAANEIADLFEQARDRLKERFGITNEPPAIDGKSLEPEDAPTGRRKTKAMAS